MIVIEKLESQERLFSPTKYSNDYCYSTWDISYTFHIMHILCIFVFFKFSTNA